jgi:hypothetical protein
VVDPNQGGSGSIGESWLASKAQAPGGRTSGSASGLCSDRRAFQLARATRSALVAALLPFEENTRG